MYIRLSDNAILSEAQVRSDFPNTSFPAIFPCPDGYAVVFPSPTPTYDPITQYYREIAPEQINGKWYQKYEVVDLDAEAIARNQAAKIEQDNQRIMQQIIDLQQQCLRYLVEDAPGETGLVKNNERKAKIEALRSQLQ